jgi:hypothetical protein
MKTARSRRTLELLDRCVEALRDHKAEQVKMRHQAGDSSVELGLVFCTRHGSTLDAATPGVRSAWSRARPGSIPKMGRASYGTVSRPCIKLGGDHRGDRTLGRPRKHGAPSLISRAAAQKQICAVLSHTAPLVGPYARALRPATERRMTQTTGRPPTHGAYDRYRQAS